MRRKSNILFNQCFIKNGKLSVKFARWLTRAQQAREEADYHYAREFSKLEVEAGIKAGKEFVAEVKKIVKNPQT